MILVHPQFIECSWSGRCCPCVTLLLGHSFADPAKQQLGMLARLAVACSPERLLVANGLQVSYTRGMSIISLICNVQRTSEILERVFRVLGSQGINVKMMSQV